MNVVSTFYPNKLVAYMKTLFEILFLFAMLYILFNIHKKEKKSTAEARVYLDGLMESSVEYQFLENRKDFKSTEFKDEEVSFLSSLMNVNIPRPDPFTLRSFLGTTLDRKKHLPFMKYKYICVKMHKYTWHSKEWVLFDVEMHKGDPVMKGNELTHPFYAGNIVIWSEMHEIEKNWSNFVFSLSDLDHKKILSGISQVK